MKLLLSSLSLTLVKPKVSVKYSALCGALNVCLQALGEPAVSFSLDASPSSKVLPKVILNGEGWRITFTAQEGLPPVPVVYFETLLGAFTPNLNWEYHGTARPIPVYPSLTPSHKAALVKMVALMRPLRRTQGFKGFHTS